MILGVLIRVVLSFLRARGVPVPDPSRLRRRQPRVNITGRLTDQLTKKMTGDHDKHHSGPDDPAGRR
ncbi:hypothetical protein [Catenulispora rubra]|uniref:hypothetical protein n=1 Tax=Catenulispora rubra TaxID=280293 RepID=UPI00189246C8|nr:hypothetical protein [Catenulispora rubra]